MLGNHGQVGWGGPPDGDGDSNRDGGGGGKYTQEEILWKFRFKMNYSDNNEIEIGKPVTHRVLFLDGAPFRFYEHGLFKYNKRKFCGHFTALCLKKNKIASECPLCSDENWPYWVGLFCIIDLGQIVFSGNSFNLYHRTWTNSKGEEIEDSFPRLVLGAKWGSNDKPGVLRELGRLSERKGGTLEGTVWDTTRTGKKEAGVGESWDYIERISPDRYEDYLINLGANREKLNVNPIRDWRSICKPLPADELRRIISGGVASPTGRNSARYDGAGYGPSDGPPSDDRIPF